MSERAAPFDASDLESLGGKLAQLDLTDRERAALAALLGDEVDGFDHSELLEPVRTGLRRWSHPIRTVKLDVPVPGDIVEGAGEPQRPGKL